MNALVFAAAMFAQSVESGPLAFTVDVAQLVVLGGLIWRLAEMSSAVKNLTLVTKELSDAGKEFSAFMSKTVTRLSLLERDTDRRDRRHDDERTDD